MEWTQKRKPDQHMIYFRKPEHGPSAELTKFFHFIEFIGNIQGDGRKFLGHFIRHFGPQISSESLRQGHIRSSEWSQHLQQKWLIQSVNGWVDQLLYWHQHSGSVHGYSEIRSRSNVWKEHTHTEGHIYMIKLTFCCKFWVYSLRMTLFGRFWWYLWSGTSYGV